MSKVVREDIDNLNAVITVTIAKEDYEPKLKAELNNYRKKAHMKGFRKGKTPLGYIRKMYGKGILVDVINNALQDDLGTFLKEEDIEILGQPLPSEAQEDIDFDLNNLKDYIFKFDIGLAPKFEVAGVSGDTAFDIYKVDVAEEMVTKDLDMARQRIGQSSSVEGKIQEKDIVAFNAEELDGDASKEGGWAVTFNVLVDDNLNDEFRKELLTKQAGDKVRFNIYDIEKDRDEDYVKKYLLKIEDADKDTVIGQNFEGIIADISRVVPAELNEEFFDNFFGEGKVKTEEEARNLIEEGLVKSYDQQADSILFRDFQDRLLELNNLSIPDAFLRRWLIATNENMTETEIDKQYESFAQNLRWSMIKGKIVKNLDIEVKDDDIFEGFKNRVRQYFGGQMDELVILNTANRLMEDEEQVNQIYQEMVSDKIFEGIKGIVKLNDKKVSSEDFNEIIRKAREEAMAKMSPPVEAANEDESATEEVTEDVEQG